MGIDVVTLAVAKKYTNDSVAGAGAVAGVPCKIQSITAITGGNRVTFLWTDNNGDDHTSTMDVMNGDKGDTGADGAPGADGLGIKSVAINASNHLIVTYDDDTTEDAGEIPNVQADWNEASSSAASFIKNKPDLSVYQTKVESAVNGNFAGLDANGQTTDSGKKAADFATAQALANEAATRSAMGAKNMLPFDLATIKANNTTGTWNNNVYTLNGVDFTFNADGSVLVDGTATGGNAEVDYLLNLSISGDFILSDAVAGVASNYWAFAKVDGDNSNLLILTSDEIPASISSTMDYFRIKVFSGKTASNILFKPMLRLASDPDNTYQPYAMTNQQITPYVQSISNPNLLDNPWFTVNQRGVTSWSSDYGVDRWTLTRASVAVQTNKSLNFTWDGTGGSGIIGQYFEDWSVFNGKTVTASAIIDNKFYSVTFTNVSETNNQKSFELGVMQLNFSSAWGTIARPFQILINDTTTHNIKAVKLELGSVSTLAMDTVPSYATELIKCQRYFLRISVKDASNWMLFCMVWSNSAMNYILSTPVEMRSIPTVSVSNIANFIICKGASTNSRKTGTGINCFEKISTSLVGTIDVSETDLALGDMYVIKAGSANDYIDFSADL